MYSRCRTSSCMYWHEYVFHFQLQPRLHSVTWGVKLSLSWREVRFSVIVIDWLIEVDQLTDWWMDGWIDYLIVTDCCSTFFICQNMNVTSSDTGWTSTLFQWENFIFTLRWHGENEQLQYSNMANLYIRAFYWLTLSHPFLHVVHIVNHEVMKLIKPYVHHWSSFESLPGSTEYQKEKLLHWALF